MREIRATASLYLRLDLAQDTAMREAVRASPHRYRSVSEFIREAIRNQIRREHKRRNVGTEKSKP